MMANEVWKAKVNAVDISVDDLRRAVEEVQQLAPEDRDWEGRLLVLNRLFRRSPHKGIAIEYRLVAMCRLLEAELPPGWALPEWPLPKGVDGSIAVDAAMWRATAIEQLVFGEGDPMFDRASFVERVASFAESEGSA